MDTKELSYGQSLVEAGLTKDEALVYETLVLRGPLQAGVLKRHVPLSRPLVYKVLGSLEASGLVEKRDEPGKVAVFAPAHPLKLQELVEKRFENAQNAKSSLKGAISRLISDFNLVSGKPGIRFYEGADGVREVLNDALTAKTEILAYIDIETVEREMSEASRAFGIARKKRGLHKRNIAVDTPANRALVDQGYLNDLTEERLIPWSTPTFGVSTQIYDDRVSYLTFGAQKIGVIVNDPAIAAMHRGLFELAWSHPSAYVPKTHAAKASAGESDNRSNTA